jgi:hypothetical protein
MCLQQTIIQPHRHLAKARLAIDFETGQADRRCLMGANTIMQAQPFNQKSARLSGIGDIWMGGKGNFGRC